MNAAAAADKVIDAYNAQDFDAMESLMAEDLDFAHYNRDLAFDNRASLMDALRLFANDLLESRKFETPERVTTSGNLCVREGYWTATPKVDVDAINAKAGETIRLKFCTVMRFDDAGTLVEWKDHG